MTSGLPERAAGGRLLSCSAPEAEPPAWVSTGGGEILLARYELMCILRPDLDEAGLEASIERITALVGIAGGTIEKLERWGRRHLAYPIAGRTEGFYILQTFTGTGPIANELTRRLNINEDVLRSLVVRRDLKHAPAAPAAADEPSAMGAPAEVEAPLPIELNGEAERDA